MNRILTSPNGGGSYDYDHDILGFRTWRNYGYSGVQLYLWDEVGRLKSCVGNSAGARYEYRADGMRIKKVEGLTIGWNGDEGSASGYYTEVMTLNAPTERYWYDGQMAHEEDRTFKVGSTTYKNVTKYGLGARGLDYIHHFDDQTDVTSVAFPIYDGHGNMIATLSRSGSSPYYSTGNLRLYDVWGSVRSGSSSGIPNQRYCANLGHRQDDESSLIYMRARYYEPSTGRFVSEDSVRDGQNWFGYCSNNPVTGADSSGGAEEYETPTDSIIDWVRSMLSGVDSSIGIAVVSYLATKVAGAVFSSWKRAAVAYLRLTSEELLRMAMYDAITGKSIHEAGNATNNAIGRSYAAALAGQYGRRSVARTVAGYTLKILSWMVEFMF